MNPRGTDYAHLFPAEDAAIENLIQQKLLFAPWTGNIARELITNADGSKTWSLKSSNKAIVSKVDGFNFGSGNDTAEIPLMLDLEDPPQTGNAYFPGTGEELRYEFKRCYINQVGKAVQKDKGLMSQHRFEKKLQQLAKADPKLTQYMVQWMNAEFISAIYEGHSMNCTKGKILSPEGIGANQVLHPNMYVNNINPSTGAGSFAAVGAEGKNKTVANIQASSLVTGTELQLPSIYFLHRLGEKLDELDIQKMASHNGVPYWLVVANRQSINALKENGAIRTDWTTAYMGKEYDNPLFGQEVWIFDEFMFLPDNIAPRMWDNSVLNFEGLGKKGYVSRPTSTGSKDHAFMTVLGDNSLGYANCVPFQRRYDSDNFDLFKEMLMLTIFGVARAETVSEDIFASYFAKNNDVKTVLATAYNVRNRSSLLVATAI